jgi:hypothetical protein
MSRLFVRLCVIIVTLQLVVVGSIYFLRLEDKVWAFPPLVQFFEAKRQVGNLDAAWTAWDEEQRIWGYVDRHSIPPGGTFNIMLSHGLNQSDFKARIEIYRVGSYGPASTRRQVYRSEVIEVEFQETPVTAAATGAGWVSAMSVTETAEWASGVYTIDVVGEDGKRDTNVASIVVTDRKRSGDILVKIPTNTHQAYNKWGGHSLYKAELFGARGAIVSFDRPTYHAFFDYEYYFVTWLDNLAKRENLSVSYISDFDLHTDQSWPDGYELLVSVGHDEYWSKEMFDAVERRLFAQGKNLLNLGANTAYWQIRYGDVDRPPEGGESGRQMICYKSTDDPIALRVPDAKLLVTGRFRDDNRRPETMLLGVGYESWFPPYDPARRYPYRVVDTSLPFFAGTGWKVGESINDIVGYEWDNRDPEGDGSRLWKEGVSANALLDSERIKVLFEGEPIDVDGKKGKAEAVYFETPAGAKVFSAGSIRWSWGLAHESFATDAFRLFNKNLVFFMLGRGIDQAPAPATSEAAGEETLSRKHFKN